MDNDNNWPTPEEQLINWYTPMVEYINERYEDDTFEFIRRDTWSNDSIFVSSEKFPDEQIMVSHVTADGRDYFNDDYLYYKFREQATDKIEEILKDALDHEFKLFYSRLSPGNTTYVLPSDISVDDYMSNPNSWLRFSAMVAPEYDISDTSFVADKLKNAFELNNVLLFNASVSFHQDYEVYESLSQENIHIRRSSVNPRISIFYYRSRQEMEFTWSGLEGV
jgi:hypothetical protein